MSSISSASPSSSGASGPLVGIAKLLRANLQTYALIFATVIIWLYFSYLTNGSFLSPQNFSNLFRQMVITGFLSVGMVLVIVTGNIDLSVGKLAGFVSVVVAAVQANFLTVQFPDQPILIAALSVGTGIAVGFLWGVVQGYIIAYLRVTAFIVTLGSSWLLNGLILLVTEGRTIPANQPTFAQIAQGYLPNEIGWIIAVITIILLFYGMISGRRRKRRYDFELPPMALDIAKTVGFSVLVVGYVYMVNQYRGIQAPVLLLALVALAVAYVSNNTRFGRYAYAIGGNRQAAQFSGVNIRRNLFTIFVLMGTLCGVSGVTLASYVGYGTISAGQGYELDAIAACILGGTSTLGGVGTVFGAMVGSIIMVSLTNGLQMTNTPAALQYVLKGIVLVIAVYADIRIKRGSSNS
ncbi:MAG: sugar ABC transporter permease [Anaerolineae bacterium]|nr:sugar ABC transporter permease [Chloroflexota bacterium]MBN8638861.1 sugar ABC transporter permease [Anaerolineae bacterium]